MEPEPFFVRLRLLLLGVGAEARICPEPEMEILKWAAQETLVKTKNPDPTGIVAGTPQSQFEIFILFRDP